MTQSEAIEMRKQYKRNARSCGLCKPHKAGRDRRWKHKDRMHLIVADMEMRAAKRAGRQLEAL